MAALLTPRFWLALGLVVILTLTHGMAYRSGRASLRAQWDAERIAQRDAAIKSEQAARAREQALQAAKTKVEVTYAKHQKQSAVAAAATATELDRLRDALAQRDAGEAAGTAPGAHGTGGLERELLGHCAKALTDLAAQADRLEDKVVGLQGYAREVCGAQ